MSERARPPAIDPARLPARLAARPRDRRGLPIPPVNLHPDPATGEPGVDFTTINTIVSTALAADRRCSLCAGEIGYWAFLGGPRAADLMRYTVSCHANMSLSARSCRVICRRPRLVCDSCGSMPG